ncbi:MAG: hypothetical protein ACSHXI_05445 [Hoeflea sp.]|uniref:hypothetical protein n=1 Tax=Hoeflea sp. TaxID=1940281 RepID=UPI003EF3D481
MSGNGEIDQCPFCNAVWGACSHIQLLMALEAETSNPGKTGFRACASSNTNQTLPLKRRLLLVEQFEWSIRT